MYFDRRIRDYLQRHGAMRLALAHGSVIVLGALLLINVVSTGIFKASAQGPCPIGAYVYVVVSGDTLGAIATHYKVDIKKLAAYNHISNPNLIYIHEIICIPPVETPTPTPTPIPPAKGLGNFFPYGECTWYASKRYYELHHIYVPWTKHSDAWQWTARARDFHWIVSTRPSVGAIMNLQPWVEGSYGLGHVAIVEKILPNGHVITSNLNWGIYYWRVTYVEFAPGPGVTFITF